MCYERPAWAGNLTRLYCCLRIDKRNKKMVRRYYREIQKEKLLLAERGINQEKIHAICRWLVNPSCVRGFLLKSCRDLENTVMKPDVQLTLNFNKIK